MNRPKFGFADVIITPEHPEQFFLDGYGFRLKPAEGVRDDLHAKVCAIVSEGRTFLLFSLDLIGLRPASYELITAQISEITGIPKESVALCCIHTHAAPATGLLNELPIHTDYLAYVGECCANAALSAVERAECGSFRFTKIPDAIRSSYNRRKGRDVIDRSIRVAAFHNEDGVLRGVLASASCHAVVCTDYRISADYLSVLNRLSSDAVPYLFLQGRGADIDPMLYLKLPIEELTEQLGHELADPVFAFAREPFSGTAAAEAPKWEYEWVRIPMKAQSDTDALKCRIAETLETYRALPVSDIRKHYALRKLQWYRHMFRVAESGESFDSVVPLQYLAVGKLCVFLFVPFELLTLTGNKLEEMFYAAGYARESVYVCGYANITEGYLAPQEEFAFGGYEVQGAASWYNISETVPESEEAVLRWFQTKADTLKAKNDAEAEQA